ncbi:N-glycosylase/DNA lyase [Golovinomyces cichoracearum]|uniref:DNA-(apurinic or apyrimidinic site) lyase n=1 Tax=Golovinomyces cichoracearum TaxID=62708 RepID=A0A420HKW8_9PEZI|nr:N-glycosylase/DNA lyase [Golovinomyces cichoracearum]
MANKCTSKWRKLPVILTELCIDTTLRCGQSFRWKKLPNNTWSCALHGRIISLKQDSDYLYYTTTWPTASMDLSSTTSSTEESIDENDDTEALLLNYLNLKPSLQAYYEHWSSVDPNFKKRAPTFTGVRILKQDAWEALIGFICSSNNNIIRISQMVGNLCIHYGQLIGHIGDQAFYDFPSPKALSGTSVESHLRVLGFGYRAGYISKTAKIILEIKPEGWLESLHNQEPYGISPSQSQIQACGREGYREAHNQLLQLQGVGPKVADCVCLMGLGWCEAVPIDTHVLKIAQRDYNFDNIKYKTLTKFTYNAIGDHFRKLWGREAGWAHSVLFAADLRVFSKRLSNSKDFLTLSVNEVSEKIVEKRDFEMDESRSKVQDDKASVQVESSKVQKIKRRKFVS